MNYYFLDFENVGTDGLKTITKIKSNDQLVIFYSDKCKNISLDFIAEITAKDIGFSCHKVSIGTKNALDFQLSSYLGYLIGHENSSNKYYIVSNDKGFDCVCDFWKEKQFSVNRISSVQDTVLSKTPASKKAATKVKASDLVSLQEINDYLSKEDCPEIVLAIFNQYKTKQAICNGMNKEFRDSKKVSTIYKKLKPLLKEKNKS